MSKATKKTTKRVKRRTDEQVRELIGKVEEKRRAGVPLMKALDELGIPYSNYNYWISKRGAGTPGRDRGVAGGRGGVFSVLDEMRANRAQHQELEKRMRVLDTQFDQLKLKLGRS